MSIVSNALRFAVAALAWMIFAPPTVAVAQDKVEVTAGGIVVLKRDMTGTVTDEKSDRGATILKSVQGPATTLAYVPPAGAPELTDTVRYKLNGADQTVTVAVRPSSPTLTSPEFYEASFKALFLLFVLAVLVESGLALLFRWRPFIDYFDTRTMNVLVAFLFSLLFVRLFHLDIATSLVNTYSVAHYPANWSGMLLTALIIAGGSTGVNRIFRALGFRAVGSAEDNAPPPPKENEAWVAVSLLRDKAVGSANVLINAAAAGTISGASPTRRFLRYFVRDKGRFPQSGGHTVTPDESYEITLQAHDAKGEPLPLQKWGPYKIRPRAIIDIEFRV